MVEQIRVGIIGTGKHGSRYAHHIVEDLQSCFKLVAISRRSIEGKEQGERWKARWIDDWRKLVEDTSVDAVITATTPNLNLEIAHLCADHKKPLLLEKPIATDYRVAKEIVDRFTEEQLGLTIGQTLRYNSVICALRDRFAEMGPLYSLFASQRLEPSSLDWLEDPEVAGGGVIFHTAVHMFDAIRFITGLEVVRIRGSVRSIFNQKLEDLLSAEIELSNGAIGILDTSKVSPARAGRYEFVCEQGHLQGDQIHGMLQKIIKTSIEELSVTPPGPALLPLLKDWYKFLTQKGINPIPATEGLAAVKICHACNMSVKTGGWVSLDRL